MSVFFQIKNKLYLINNLLQIKEISSNNWKMNHCYLLLMEYINFMIKQNYLNIIFFISLHIFNTFHQI